MKRTLLTLSLLALGYASFAQTAFTPGNLAVVQAGTDGASPVETKGMTIHVKEFTRSGSLVQTIDVTSSGTNAVVFGTPAATTEGASSLSYDKNYLTFMGYNADAGTDALATSTSASVKRTAVVFTADGNYSIAKFDVFDTKSPRTIVTNNGTDFWMGGGSTGLQYGTTASETVTNIIPNGIMTAYRYVTIFNNKLYFSTSNNSTGGSAIVVRIGEVSGGLPTSEPSTPVYTALSGLPTATIVPHSFVFFDTDNNGTPDLLYVGLDDGLQKYAYSSGTWVDKGKTATSKNLKGLTGYIATGSTDVTIYGILDTGVGNKVVSFVDNAGFTTNISATQTDLITAPTGTIFKGLTFTPGTTQASLPVTLTSFNGRQQLQTVKLNWATASEQNNSHFNVLRANDSKKFTTIGKVDGNGTTNMAQQYTFTDNNPYGGNNYYQLEQVDFDGKTQKSEVVAVKTDIKDKTLRIKADGDQLEATIYADGAGAASLSIANVSGQKVYNDKLQLTNGYNQHSVNIAQLQAGVYIATVVVNGKAYSQKFIR